MAASKFLNLHIVHNVKKSLSQLLLTRNDERERMTFVAHELVRHQGRNQLIFSGGGAK